MTDLGRVAEAARKAAEEIRETERRALYQRDHIEKVANEAAADALDHFAGWLEAER